MLRRGCVFLWFAVAALLAASAGSAAVLLRIEEKSPYLVEVTAKGSLDLTGLGAPSPRVIDFRTGPIIVPNEGYLAAGVPWVPVLEWGAVDVYQDAMINPAASYGTGGRAPWWPVANDQFFAISGSANAILVPRGYVSGAPIDAFTHYEGAPGWTLDSLGLALGRHRIELTNGDWIGVTVTAVPLPGALPLALAALAALAGLGAWRARA